MNMDKSGGGKYRIGRRFVTAEEMQRVKRPGPGDRRVVKPKVGK